jgi:hypothetical protein
VLQGKVRGRVQFTNSDRLFFPAISLISVDLKAIYDHPAGDLVRWHRAGFRRYWRWEPQIHADMRALIRRMSVDNPLWGAPRIHGRAQGWCTFLRSHAPDIAAIDLFVVPTMPSTCSMPSSSFGWSAETLSGSTLQPIRPRTGSHARSPRHSLGMRPRAT